MCCCKLLKKEYPQVHGSQRSMRKPQTRQARQWKLLPSKCALRMIVRRTTLQRCLFHHGGILEIWAGLIDWAHSVQGCWPHRRNVLDTPLQAGECVCSRAGCGYIFHNLGVDIIQLACSNCSMWRTRVNNSFTTHVTVLPGLQLREHCCSHYLGLP